MQQPAPIEALFADFYFRYHCPIGATADKPFVKLNACDRCFLFKYLGGCPEKILLSAVMYSFLFGSFEGLACRDEHAVRVSRVKVKRC
jgi:hypothetical protein